ncbi:AbgT family transporter [Sedimentibacter sp. MB35-C1]|uniref:AbgT family transporter n=1 Tax=Sedimentibacter sp. MB35-C1 TaxID=3070995 RepID=UPI0027DEEB77|nr:AbgT family transporter [Sedimentibacter sp. MB35-C1]WMJ78117.1 AbgT family transporter [Sedimentibacter sp. MB35-C1]
MEKTKRKKNFLNRTLDRVEIAGNKLPHPVTLFFYLAIFVLLLSFIGASVEWSASGEILNRVTNEVEMQKITVNNLLSKEGLVYILTSMLSNFTGFAPLGVVLVVTFGIGMAEGSGFISAAVKKTVSVTPKRLIVPVVVFLGIMSNVASVVGYVVLVPLGAIIFMSYNKHPLAGMAAAFAGASGGFSANLLIGAIDPLLSGISTEGARILDPSYVVDPTGNWFFMMASTVVITIVGTIITEKIVEPRLGIYDKSKAQVTQSEMELGNMSQIENKALKVSSIVLFAMLIGLFLLCIPKTSFLRNIQTGSLVSGSALMKGIIPIITIMFFVPSVIYGKITGVYKSEKDIAAQMGKSMSTMGGYIALAFVASQFISYFEKTNIGIIIALKGAKFLGSIGIWPPLLMVIFVILASLLNLFMGSASAKWVIMAPVFIPMFMGLNISPEMTQAAFRIGDSSTNIITPLMDYFPLILAFAKKYDEDTGIGTMISTMLPYSVGFLIFWAVLLVIWMVLGLPLGPGVGVYM